MMRNQKNHNRSSSSSRSPSQQERHKRSTNAPPTTTMTPKNKNSNNRSGVPETSSLSSQQQQQHQLSSKPHAFSGAVLNPKQARELTPRTVLKITHTLGYYAWENHKQQQSLKKNNNNNNSNAGDNDHFGDAIINDFYHNTNEARVQYTVWITEAWKCLGWAEPSAALFWEMASMYHTLHVASRSIEVEETPRDDLLGGSGSIGGDYKDGTGGIQRTLSQSIPPILSCGSSASMDSVENHRKKEKIAQMEERGMIHSVDSSEERPSSPQHSPMKSSGHTSPRKGSNNDKRSSQNAKLSAASAKELPVWIVGMYLLLHCEEGVFRRNVSGEDAQRFDALMAKHQGTSPGGVGDIWKDGKGVDFGTLLMQPTLSLRAHLHGGWMDNTNFTIYILRHLRKFLLLSAIPHNDDAQKSLKSLYQSASFHEKEYTDRQNTSSNQSPSMIDPYGYKDVDEILHRHNEEHGEVGLHVQLTTEDIERLNFILQAPSGGLIDDRPMFISDLIIDEELLVYESVALEKVERVVRQQLELELLNGNDDKSQQMDENNDVESTNNEMGKLNLNESSVNQDKMNVKVQGRAEVNFKTYHKELKYSKLRGKTILMKPKLSESRLHQQEQNDGDVNQRSPPFIHNGRLHDVSVAECSDAHMYLLQPFEHVTISACSNCTIVIGAVAGLLHVVDCEKLTITAAARRILVSNCNDVSQYIFTPSPPLLVGNNRNCQFAPYNTYYDGLREDLLATGLAGAVLSADNVIVSDSIHGPALQCASNKWKQHTELTKICDVLSTDEKSLGANDDTMQTPTLVPASEFQVIFVPLESVSSKQRHLQQELNNDDVTMHSEDGSTDGPKIGSKYCNCLADILQLSPFRLPTEYERRVLIKADRIRSFQQLIESDLTLEQQLKLEEELNRGFRDWLVTSGNLRQVLDLVHLGKVES